MKNLIKLERARNNITQAELAEKVKVARQTIIAIESGRFVQSTLLAFKLLKYLIAKQMKFLNLKRTIGCKFIRSMTHDTKMNKSPS